VAPHHPRGSIIDSLGRGVGVFKWALLEIMKIKFQKNPITLKKVMGLITKSD
jgi:hypothetical protein